MVKNPLSTMVLGQNTELKKNENSIKIKNFFNNFFIAIFAIIFARHFIGLHFKKNLV